jgi:hypothetical protein
MLNAASAAIVYGSLKQHFDISAAARYVENSNVFAFDAVEYYKIADWEAAHSGTQIFMAAAPDEWGKSQQIETLGESVDEAVGNILATAFSGEVGPGFIEFGFGLG